MMVIDYDKAGGLPSLPGLIASPAVAKRLQAGCGFAIDGVEWAQTLPSFVFCPEAAWDSPMSEDAYGRHNAKFRPSYFVKATVRSLRTE